ncbi:peptidase M20 [Actinomadura sp. NBRC 104425]|uniref:M20/M25/M40 family metallo-hydrolase n=1 Tax=Actinomadura sp. NBRC 104425 TaxID=3032204 RepID=UPI0024A0F13D|nr:M20/M25/M40 family metallo-hydrolase [Actinomadura sp. NBRC 104425]GLZ12798.1 peptidase M20 [Actinomadura sp. NBRC 104425]
MAGAAGAPARPRVGAPGPDAAALTAAAAHVRERYAGRLAELVAVDSGTADTAGVNRVAGLVAGYARDAGMRLEPVRLDDGRAALVARRRGRGRRKILLTGHMDTVFPAGTAAARPLRVDGDRAYGPGVCAGKGGLLAGLAAVEALVLLGAERYGEVALVCSPDEEAGSPLSRMLLRREAHGAAAALGLRCARPDGAVVAARKGGAEVEIVLRGRAAHTDPGAAPPADSDRAAADRGGDAALAAARLTVALQELDRSRLGVRVRVGVLQAGTAPGMVADSARLVACVRADRAADFDAVLGDIRRLARGHGVAGVAAEVVQHAPVPPWEGGPRTAALVDTARRVGLELGLHVRAGAAGGGSGANIVAASGTPVLDGLGPVGGACRSPGEWLDLASVVPRTALLAGLIDRIAETGCTGLGRLGGGSAI